MFWMTLHRMFVLGSFSTGPHVSSEAVQIAVYYYPWYDGKKDYHWDGGYLRSKLAFPQTPLLGQYDLQDPAVANKHLEWANRYGISQFICSWWGPGIPDDWVILNNMLQSPQLGNLKIALLYESFGLMDMAPDGSFYFDPQGKAFRKLLANVEYMVQHYFQHPNYMKVDGGKPVLYFYVTRIFSGDYRQAFATLRLTLRQHHGIDLYLVGDEVYWPEPQADRIAVWDAVTAYNMHGPVKYAGYPAATNLLDDIETNYAKYQIVANAHNVTLLPGIFPAFNDRAVRLQADHYPIPHEIRQELAGTGQYTTFWEGLQMAKRILQQQTTRRVGPPTIVVTSWNEWHEDSSIEPTVENVRPSNKPTLYTMGYTYEAYGFKLLEVVQRFLNDTNAASMREPQEVESLG
jgi:glycoprotein endo-alpha-1,2-mannosidase